MVQCNYSKEREELQMTKAKELRIMHETMQSMNNEDAYMYWIANGWIPDEPTEEDFENCVNSECDYIEIKILYNELMREYAKDGLYKPPAEVVEYVAAQNLDISIIS
jgi:hypothetical protein